MMDLSVRPGVCIALLALLSAPLWAGEATIEASDGDGERASMQLEYRDDGAVRMNVPGQAGGYLLVRDQVAYTISDQNGQPVVMRLDALKGLGQAMPVPSATGDLAEAGDLTPTGRSETVAGVRGEVWSLIYQDDRGQSRQAEIVLSSDPRAVELTRAMNSFSRAMADSMGQPSGDSTLGGKLSGKGVLRWGQAMRVTSLNSRQPPLSRFSLPAQPTAVPSAGGFADQLGNLFGDKAERQKNQVGDRVEREADSSLDQKVKGFLDSVF